MVCGCFCSTAAELSRFDRSHTESVRPKYLLSCPLQKNFTGPSVLLLPVTITLFSSPPAPRPQKALLFQSLCKLLTRSPSRSSTNLWDILSVFLNGFSPLLQFSIPCSIAIIFHNFIPLMILLIPKVLFLELFTSSYLFAFLKPSISPIKIIPYLKS